MLIFSFSPSFPLCHLMYFGALMQRDPSDPEESFRLWVQKKQEQQQKERQMVELKKLEEDAGYLLRSREESERAFKL